VVTGSVFSLTNFCVLCDRLGYVGNTHKTHNIASLYYCVNVNVKTCVTLHSFVFVASPCLPTSVSLYMLWTSEHNLKHSSVDQQSTVPYVVLTMISSTSAVRWLGHIKH